MANIASAKKRARQAIKRNSHNTSRYSALRTAIKKVNKAIADSDVNTARDAFLAFTPLVDRLAGKGIIHRNKAARHKSRLNAKIRAIQT